MDEKNYYTKARKSKNAYYNNGAQAETSSSGYDEKPKRNEKNGDYPKSAREFLQKIEKSKRECHVNPAGKNLILVCALFR